MTLRRYEPPEPLEEGIRLGEDDEYYYECWPMFFNDRLVLRSKRHEYSWDYGWCFEKCGGLVVAAAFAVWDPETQDEPVGWHKNATGDIRRRAPRREENPEYNRERCIHGSYVDGPCKIDQFCEREGNS